MSETTRKLRAFKTYSVGACGVRDLAADAIEAVEAQVAEAVARVEKLEAKFVTTTDKIEPAPIAPPAPRGFRVGDRVRITKAHRCSSDWIGCEGRIVAGREDSLGDWTIGDLTKFAHLKTVPMHSQALTLVRAAAAPEAPAEMDLVERLARGEYMHWGGSTTATMSPGWTGAVRGTLSTLRAESRLCAPGEIARLTAERDEAQGASILNANAVRLQKARAEAAEKELAEARAISAATAERVRNETQIATELRHELDDANDRLTSQSRSIEEMHAELAEAHKWRDDLRAKLAAAEKALDVERRTMVMCPDGVTPTRRVVDSVEARERAVAEFAREEIDRKNELNALRAELSALKAKPRFRTRKVTAADARALDDEWAKSKYVGRNSWVLAMNALGFRRRVDGAK